MRVVTTPNFCKVCIEGLWLSLLKRIDLIDNLTASCQQGTDAGVPWFRSLNLDLIPLAHLRKAPEGEEDSLTESPNNEVYSITWAKDGEVLERFQDQTQISLKDEEAVGKYTVHVEFSTDEVRVDKDDLLTSVREYEVTSLCQDT